MLQQPKHEFVKLLLGDELPDGWREQSQESSLLGQAPFDLIATWAFGLRWSFDIASDLTLDCQETVLVEAEQPRHHWLGLSMYWAGVVRSEVELAAQVLAVEVQQCWPVASSVPRRHRIESQWCPSIVSYVSALLLHWSRERCHSMEIAGREASAKNAV